MIAATFHHPLGDPTYPQLLELWKSNWLAHGWPIAVLGFHSHPHRDHQLLHNATLNLPTPLDRRFEHLCFTRWSFLSQLALDANSPVLAMDYDLCNISFPIQSAHLILSSSGPSLLGGGCALITPPIAPLLPSAIASIALSAASPQTPVSPPHATDGHALKALAQPPLSLLAERFDFVQTFIPHSIHPSWSPSSPLVHIHHLHHPYDRLAAFNSLLKRYVIPKNATSLPPK